MALEDKTSRAFIFTINDKADKATTLAGYGITDAASSSHTHTFASLTSKPTTLSGYGITDAYTSTYINSIDIGKASWVTLFNGTFSCAANNTSYTKTITNINKYRYLKIAGHCGDTTGYFDMVICTDGNGFYIPISNYSSGSYGRTLNIKLSGTSLRIYTKGAGWASTTANITKIYGYGLIS